MEEPDHNAILADLRRQYVEATPSQRLRVARDRLRYPGHDPNRLIAYVSAVEGFARSLAMHLHAKSKSELTAVYPDYRRKGAQELIEEFLSARGMGEPALFFQPETWAQFLFAVEYRNLLAHECTYLGQDISPALIQACHSVLSALAAANGLRLDEA